MFWLREGALKKHMVNYSGEELFNCEKQGFQKAFPLEGNLHGHKKKYPQDGGWDTSLISRRKKTKSGKRKSTTLTFEMALLKNCTVFCFM